jgi:hypothetical protein
MTRDPQNWLGRAVTLDDYFDPHTTLRIAQPQPQYGTVQLNATFKGETISVDVRTDDLFTALGSVLGVTEEEAAAYLAAREADPGD